MILQKQSATEDMEKFSFTVPGASLVPRRCKRRRSWFLFFANSLLSVA